MAQIVERMESLLAGSDGTGNPEVDGEVFFNGRADREEDYETFAFEPFGCNPCPSEPGKDFSFCKTAHRPYDIVVTACLAVAAENLGEGIEVSSDGEAADWTAGVELSSEVLGRTVPNPLEETRKEPSDEFIIKEARRRYGLLHFHAELDAKVERLSDGSGAWIYGRVTIFVPFNK